VRKWRKTRVEEAAGTKSVEKTLSEVGESEKESSVAEEAPVGEAPAAH
jgi:hypothetical protein